MGDSGCLLQVHSFPYESNQGNSMYALTDSVSFGRFMSESLCWERWSTFTHRKYVEEAERYAQPGSVAQKKAFFEARYKGLGVRKSGVVYGLKMEDSRDLQSGEKGGKVEVAEEERVSVCCDSFSLSSEGSKSDNSSLEENSLSSEDVESATSEQRSSFSSIEASSPVKQGKVPPAPAMPVSPHQVKKTNAAQSTAESVLNDMDETSMVNLVTNKEPDSELISATESSSIVPNDMDKEPSNGEFGHPIPAHDPLKNARCSKAPNDMDRESSNGEFEYPIPAHNPSNNETCSMEPNDMDREPSNGEFEYPITAQDQSKNETCSMAPNDMDREPSNGEFQYPITVEDQSKNERCSMAPNDMDRELSNGEFEYPIAAQDPSNNERCSVAPNDMDREPSNGEFEYPITVEDQSKNEKCSMAPNCMDRELSNGEFGYPIPARNESKNESMKSLDDDLSDHPPSVTVSPKRDVVCAIFSESSVTDGNRQQSPILATYSAETATDSKKKVEVSKLSTDEKKKAQLSKTRKDKTGKRFSILACLCFKPEFPEETDFFPKDPIKKTLVAQLQKAK